MAAQSVQYLLGTDKDVIHVNAGSGLTTAHLLSLMHRKSPQSRIWGFGIDLPCKGRKTMKNIDSLGATKCILACKTRKRLKCDFILGFFSAIICLN